MFVALIDTFQGRANLNFFNYGPHASATNVGTLSSLLQLSKPTNYPAEVKILSTSKELPPDARE